VGFPGETEEEFEDTYQFLETQSWSRIHVFPYSIRPGTTAAKIENPIPQKTISYRARKLRELSLQRQRAEAERQVGLTKEALILENPTHGAQGLTRDYWPVFIANFEHKAHQNREIQVKITGSLPFKNGESILTGTTVAN
jgi:threonylcarbamoyladenosine tRNA methylthiotransferase MtaB